MSGSLKPIFTSIFNFMDNLYKTIFIAHKMQNIAHVKEFSVLVTVFAKILKKRLDTTFYPNIKCVSFFKANFQLNHIYST